MRILRLCLAGANQPNLLWNAGRHSGLLGERPGKMNVKNFSQRLKDSARIGSPLR